MSISNSALQRSIGMLAFRIGTEMDRKRAHDAQVKLASTEQQFQIDFDADVLPTPTWTQVGVDFREKIIINHLYSNTPYDRPHVSFGHEIIDGPPVSISHHVRTWAQDRQGNFTGVTIEVGVWDPAVPGAGSPLRVRGRIHLRVQGDSIPIDDDLATDMDG